MLFFKFKNIESYKLNDIRLKVCALGEDTLIRADQTIKHIKKHKKTYRMVVFYFALLMAPSLMEHGGYWVRASIEELALIVNHMPINEAIEIVSKALYIRLIAITKWVVITMVSLEMFKSILVGKSSKNAS